MMRISKQQTALTNPPEATTPIEEKGKPKRYSSVAQMLRDLSEDKAVGEEMARDVEARRIIAKLMAIRSERNLSQADIAKHMNCTQSRISKLENGLDDNLTIGEFQAYTDALGLEMSIVLVRKNRTLVQELMHHLTQVRRITNRLSQLVGKDLDITVGIGEMVAAMMNGMVSSVTSMGETIKKAITHLKSVANESKEKRPIINLDTSDHDPDCDSDTSAKCRTREAVCV